MNPKTKEEAKNDELSALESSLQNAIKLNDWNTYDYGYFVVKRGWYNGDYFWKVESKPGWNIDLTQTFTSYNSDIASEIDDQCTS